MTAAKPKGLQASLAAALAQLPDVMERDQQRTQGAKYRYLNEAGVLPPIRRALLEHGLTALASTTSVQRDPAPRVDRNGEVKPEQVVTVLIDVTITCADTGEQLTLSLAGASIDRDGRGVASARTDALKGLRQALLIAADDPDQDEHRPPRERREDLTYQEVAKIAEGIGYTPEQRDLVLASAAAIDPPVGTLTEIPQDQLAAAVDVLRDPAALTYAREHTAKAAA